MPHLDKNGVQYVCKSIAHVPYGKEVIVNESRFDVLLLDERTMELVPMQDGRIPFGKTPVGWS